MLPSKLAFVDIETTGTKSNHDRIIEIGILRVENNKLTKTYQSLINPQVYLPKEITMITGIVGEQLVNAPTFREIKDEVMEILDDCTFVAHNVRFDYGFLKNEFIRENMTFSAKHFCTVRLSRLLFPQWPRHNLDAIVQQCNIPCETRHRAFDDAKVLYDFYTKLLNDMSPEELETALSKTMKKPSLPINLPMEQLEKLPDKPGVYVFYGNQAEQNTKKKKESNILDVVPLYVGKSVNIRNRVLSHFSADIASSTEMAIAQQVKHIDTVTTIGELGALLLESQMIKEMLPLYNKRSRIKHELIALRTITNADGYNTCILEPITKITKETLENFHGFFRSRKQAKAFLADIAKNYTLCEKLLGLEKTSTACFAQRLGRCQGACIKAEKEILYNLRLMTALREIEILPWPFSGPIAYEESDVLGKKEYFLIDKWCYRGKITVDPEGNKRNDMVTDVTFDLDVYKIIRQFLKNPAHRNKIRPIAEKEILLTSEQLIPHL